MISGDTDAYYLTLTASSSNTCLSVYYKSISILQTSNKNFIPFQHNAFIFSTSTTICLDCLVEWFVKGVGNGSGSMRYSKLCSAFSTQTSLSFHIFYFFKSYHYFFIFFSFSCLLHLVIFFFFLLYRIIWCVCRYFYMLYRHVFYAFFFLISLFQTSFTNFFFIYNKRKHNSKIFELMMMKVC